MARLDTFASRALHAASTAASAAVLAATIAVICAMCASCATTPSGDSDDLAAEKSQNEASVNPDLASEELSSDSSSGAKPTEEAINEPDKESDREQVQESSAGQGLVEISDLRYKSGDNGGTVVIETSAPATFRTREVPKLNQVIVEIANAHLPDRFKRPYASKEFRQEVTAVNAYQDAGSSTARVVVQFREPASASVRQKGKQLLITYAAPGAGGNFADGEAGGGAENAYAVEGSRQSRALSGSTETNGNSTHFYGKPISIEARETPVREVINALAEQSGANIVISDDVKGTVTLKLRQVPWDQALLLIMKTMKLGYVRQGTVLRIGTLASLLSESDDVRKAFDAQRLAEPLKTKIIPISFAKVEDIKKAIEPFRSPIRPANPQPTIVSDVRTSSVIITDIADNIDRMVSVVRALDKPPLQVLIEGKVLEASEKFTRSYGINWGLDGGTTSVGGRTLTTTGPTFNNAGPTSNTIGLSLGTFDVIGSLTAQIGLAETQDLVRVLSSPRIVTLNNEPATISQVTQIPIPKAVAGAGSTTGVVVGVDYKDVKLNLNVTPQITAESDVILDVDLTREFIPGATKDSGSAIESRHAKTKVLVRSGQTAVIGGVYQNDQSNSEKGVPLLRDIPVLGYLFKSVGKNSAKNELLLFLTPRILNAQRTTAEQETL